MSTETSDTIDHISTGLVPKHFYTILDVQVRVSSFPRSMELVL